MVFDGEHRGISASQSSPFGRPSRRSARSRHFAKSSPTHESERPPTYLIIGAMLGAGIGVLGEDGGTTRPRRRRYLHLLGDGVMYGPPEIASRTARD